MRKLFSLIAAVLFAGSMMAEPIIINAGDITGIESGATTNLAATVQGIQIAWEGAYYNPDNQGSIDIRVYAGKTLTLTAEENIAKVEIVGYAKKDLAPTVNAGTITVGASFASETTKKEWEDPLIVVEGVDSKVFAITCNKQMRAYAIRLTLDDDDDDPDEVVIYDWRGKIGSTILGAAGVEETTVKIHTNTDEVPAIKFGSSFVYAEGKWIAIKPAEGGFKAGDVLYMAAVFNNADDTKYAQVDLRAADGDTRIWLSDSASTINGRTSAADPIVQTYKLESDQDSLFLGRYGNTGMFVLTLMVGRAEEPQPAMNYYVTGTMTNWGPKAEYMLTPDNEGLYKGEFTFAANDEFKVTYSDGTTIDNANWFPGGMNNNYKITEAGDYAITFNPAGNVEGWYEGYFEVLKKEEPVVDTITCAKAAEDALAGETYETYVKGYVTEIAYAWSNKSMSFWMADEKDGGKVFEAYKCAIENEADAVRVGDLVKAHGTLTKYNTTPELAAGCTVEILERAPEVVPQNLGEKTIAEFLELKNRVDTCILTGAIDSLVNANYGNFNLVDETGKVYVYGLKDAEGNYCFEAKGLAEGDIITVLAIYSEYNSNPQVKNAILVRKKGQGLDNTDAEVKVEKFFRNGQLIIRKNGVEYNAQGAIVR